MTAWLFLLPLPLGFLLDLCFGDPHWMPHPVRAIGWLIAWLERLLRGLFPKTPKGERLAGVFLAILVPLFTSGTGIMLLWGAYAVHPGLWFVLETLFCYQLLAAKALRVESMKVYDRLRADDLPGARWAVSMIVGRDTQALT